MSLLATAIVGGGLLLTPYCTQLSVRDRRAYGLRPVWQTQFDALSAACGVGLLTYDLNEDYTPAGRWVLASIGLLGAMLYLAAARQAAARCWPQATAHWPSTRLILLSFLAMQLLAAAAVIIAERVTDPNRPIQDAAWNAVAAFSSLGWLRRPAGSTWIYAIVALVSACGWPVWLGFLPRRAGLRPTLTLLGTYLAFLALCAILIAALETPRGTPHGPASPDIRLAGQNLPTRLARAFVQVGCASGGGLPTEDLKERSVGEGTKLVLAAVILTGGLGGSPGGGFKWPFLLAILFATTRLLRGRRQPTVNTDRRPSLQPAAATLGLILAAALLVALGLLLIEAHTGSPFQFPPTLGDAILEAASATGGAGLSTGLTATVTSPNLSRGIRQDVDLYQYGMAWLMAAMLVARVLPVVVLARMADRDAAGAPPAAVPI